MWGQCIDLPPDTAPAAGTPTTADEQSISIICLWFLEYGINDYQICSFCCFATNHDEDVHRKVDGGVAQADQDLKLERNYRSKPFWSIKNWKRGAVVVIQLVEWLLLTPESSHGQFFDYKQFRKDQNTEKEAGNGSFQKTNNPTSFCWKWHPL